MTDNRSTAGKPAKAAKQVFDANHPHHPDYKGDAPRNGAESAPVNLTIPGEEPPIPEKERHAHDHGAVAQERSHDAEQKMKNQEREQNNRELFPKGLAQEHEKGRG